MNRRWVLSHSVRGDGRIGRILAKHFSPVPISDVTIIEREFPYRVRVDLQNAIDSILGNDIVVCHFSGVRGEYSGDEISMSRCLVEGSSSPPVLVPPEYEEVEIGEKNTPKVLRNGVWVLVKDEIRFATLLAPSMEYGQITGAKIQIGIPNSPEGTQLAQWFFDSLEKSIQEAKSYRGKILSLDVMHHYSGKSSGIQVHKLRNVARDEVILPEATVRLLDRNVIEFIKHREKLAEFRQSTKKGLLFYGPPGTGKTHTIHYLIQALPDHTTLLISAEQVGLLSEYMTLARLLQPCLVVLEDVDLIARDRRSMNSACEEVLLNKLLNEMDGLREDADILFILTTNRPESIEAALANRPGRVDQAIEFPLPDGVGRSKLIRLYSSGITLQDDSVKDIAKRTENVSAAFIKELMRRIIQIHISKGGSGEIERQEIDEALAEMLSGSGGLNLKLLGAGGLDS